MVILRSVSYRKGKMSRASKEKTDVITWSVWSRSRSACTAQP